MAKPKPPDKEEFATDAEVEHAIRTLPEAELAKLKKVASLRAAALRALGIGVGGKDLFQEAMTRTVAGDRRWRKGVSFQAHLMGVMRSVASHAGEELKGGTVMPLDAQDADPPRDKVAVRGARLASQLSSPESNASARETLRQAQAHFKDDQLVTEIMDGLAEQMTGPDIQKVLGITQTQYETAMRRLRRWADTKE